jgi:hypothetical protein
MQRSAGHDSISTTLGYVKMAEDLTGSIGEPFPLLPAELVARREGDRARASATHAGPPGDGGVVRATIGPTRKKMDQNEESVGEEGFARPSHSDGRTCNPWPDTDQPAQRVEKPFASGQLSPAPDLGDP